MGRDTRIEWTNATWNPWRGCTKVSPGCASCYMFRDQVRYGRDPSVVVKASRSTFNAPLAWQARLMGADVDYRVFTCSWSDFFHEGADAWRDEAWDIIRRTPNLTYQILTKRPERMIGRMPPDWDAGWPHVWLGVSAENQYWYNRRVSTLGLVPARVRFVSAEPLLKPIDLMLGSMPVVDWVIVGGESGGRPGHPPRPMAPEWVESIRDQCEAGGVAFFFKQWGGARPGGEARLDGVEYRGMPAA